MKQAQQDANALTTDEKIDILDKWHNAQEVYGMTVLEKEIERYTKMKDSSNDEDLIAAYEDKIDTLTFTKEGIE